MIPKFVWCECLEIYLVLNGPNSRSSAQCSFEVVIIFEKISPKSASGTFTIVEIVANVAACTFNEGSFAFLSFMEDMGISIGPSSHEWARQVDALRIEGAEEQAEHDSKNGRVPRRQVEKAAVDDLDESFLLYGPGIDDSV